MLFSSDSLIRIHGHDHPLFSKINKYDTTNEIVTINVSGKRYQTHLSVLENFPNTLLGNKQKRACYWNEKNKEYFFDRHRACFETILYYYQSNGRLRRQYFVPLDTFLEEVSFFELGPPALAEINKLENVSVAKRIDLPVWLWRQYIWYYFEYPQYSLIGRIIRLISTLLTVLSCVALAIETLPKYNSKWTNLCFKEYGNITLSAYDISVCSAKLASPFFLIQTVCVSVFTIEFILRLISTPSYYRFILSIFNWIDISAIVPYFVFLILDLVKTEHFAYKTYSVALGLFRAFGFLRIFRIYSMFKQLKTLRVLRATLKESFLNFVVVIVILTSIAFIFGTATYFAEHDLNRNVFDSIPKAMYWAIVTIATIGYGDMYPVTVPGRILACICAFVGMTTTSMLISVLVGQYQRAYHRKQFLPEQIILPVDSLEREHFQKQEFLNRKLSGMKINFSIDPVAPPPPTPASSISLSPNKTKHHFHKSPFSSHIRFIISIAEHQTNDKQTQELTDELLNELKKTIKTTGSQINLKLISNQPYQN